MFRRLWKLWRALERFCGRFRRQRAIPWYDADSLLFDHEGRLIDVDEFWKIAH